MAEEVLKESVEGVESVNGDQTSSVGVPGQSIEGISTLTESATGETATFSFKPSGSSGAGSSRSFFRPAKRN